MATKRKVKKLAGGFGEDDFAGVDEAVARNADSGEWARGENYGDNTTGDERVAMARAPARMASNEEVRAAAEEGAAKSQTFKEAFKAAKDGSTFSWNGKQYKKEYASAKKPAASQSLSSRVPVPEPVKPKAEKKYEGPKYQSLQDRARDYAAAREKSGVSMYGFRKATPREPLPTASDQAYKKGGMTASKRADGAAVRGKTRGKLI